MHQKWPDNSIYFLTISTFLHFPYFKEDGQKQIVLNFVKEAENIFSLKNLDYSIAINHFHLKFFLDKGDKIFKIKQFLNGGISFEYKKKFSMKYKEMWQSTKTLLVAQELDQKITGYIIGNLLKHKEASTFDDLLKNNFTSYGDFADKFDDDFARELVYDVIDVDEDTDGFVDLKKFKK